MASLLDAALHAQPVEVFDTVTRAALDKGFRVTLEGLPDSTVTSASREALLEALRRALRNVPVRTPRRTQWTRSTVVATPADSFALDVEPLDDNRDYTFCVESVEALSAADSTATITRIASALRGTLREYFEKNDDSGVGIPKSMLNELQRSLRAVALPAADSIVVPSTSILAAAPPLVEVIKRFVVISNANQARCTFASSFNTLVSSMLPPVPADGSEVCGASKAIPVNEVTLGRALYRLAQDPGVKALARVSRFASRLPKADAERLARAIDLALVISAVVPPSAKSGGPFGELEAIATGQTPITNPRLPVEGNANIARRASVAELRPWADNLDTTIVRLRELRELTSYIASDAAMLARLDVASTTLEETRRGIEQARTAAETQRIHLRHVMDALIAMESASQAISAGVVARDLTQVGIATTSAASYETRARWHVGQDLGVMYAWRARSDRQASPYTEAAPYLGITAYLHPVNKRGRLRWFCPLDLRCTALTLGVTTSKFEEKNRYTGLLSGIPLVLGVNTRLGDFLRIGYQAPLVYSYRWTSDTSSTRRLDRLNAVTLSLDADLREILGGLAASLFGK
ncbi:MAG: hypothetical protein ABI141_01445 [Gemmatimonadaceae bacterium]